MISMPLVMFLFFVSITLAITYWAARRTSGANAFFAANRQIKGWQNGFAVAGDYMSAASFLGIAGIIAFSGLRRFHVFRRLAGRVPDGIANRSRAITQRR
jgi:cation/acetate symporter